MPEFMEKFKTFYKEDNLEITDLRDTETLVKLALKEMKHPPNTLQFAIASCAAQLMKVHKRQFYSWIGGGGKSRILATVALLVLVTNSKFKRVRFLFPNKLLKDKDE